VVVKFTPPAGAAPTVTFAPPKISSIPLLQKSLWVPRGNSADTPQNDQSKEIPVDFEEGELGHLLHLFTKKQPPAGKTVAKKKGGLGALMGGGGGEEQGEPSPLEPCVSPHCAAFCTVLCCAVSLHSTPQ
jgi:hypothetical protein